MRLFSVLILCVFWGHNNKMMMRSHDQKSAAAACDETQKRKEDLRMRSKQTNVGYNFFWGSRVVKRLKLIYDIILGVNSLLCFVDSSSC